jgi:hypothetical protein
VKKIAKLDSRVISLGDKNGRFALRAFDVFGLSLEIGDPGEQTFLVTF